MFFSRLVCAEYELVAFPRFFPVAEETDSWVWYIHDVSGIDAAHDGKLLQMFRAHIDVGANIEDHAEAAMCRKGNGKGRAQNALGTADLDDALQPS